MKSFSFVGVGVVLFLAALGGLFWGEGRAVKTARALSEGAAIVIDADANSIAADKDGKLVHITGRVEPLSVPTDSLLTLQSKGSSVLRREVEMYQWVEVEKETETTVDGKTTKTKKTEYRKEWKDDPVDSDRFDYSSSHSNPSMPIKNERFVITEGKVGAYHLTGEALSSIGSPKPVMLQESDVAAIAPLMAFGRPVKLFNNELYSSNNPQNPQIGDLRVSFEQVTLGEISAVGLQRGDRMIGYTASNGNEVFLLEEGKQPAAAMFKNAQDFNAILAWVLRAIGLIALFAAWKFILGPISSLGGYIPIVGPFIQAGTTLLALAAAFFFGALAIGLGWIFYRPLLGLAILGAGLIAAFVFGFLGKRQSAAVSRPAVQPA
jgi:hypothetical protein